MLRKLDDDRFAKAIYFLKNKFFIDFTQEEGKKLNEVGNVDELFEELERTGSHSELFKH